MVSPIIQYYHSLGTRLRSALSRPPSGDVMVVPQSASQNSLFSGTLTLERAKSILRAAAFGDPSTQNELFDTMLETDPHLRSVYNTRRLGMTGLDWELLPANEVGKDPRINEDLANRVRDYCAEVLSGIEGLEDGLCHLNDAVGRGTCAVELVWSEDVPVEMRPIPHTLLRGDIHDGSKLRIAVGIGIETIDPEDFAAGQFMVHTPETLGGSRFRGGLLRAAILSYMFKRYAWRWWMLAIELFGMPMTVAKYPKDAGDKVRKEMLSMIKSLGVARGGIFPLGSEVELVEYGKTGTELPYDVISERVNAEYSKEFLGQTLTTQMDAAGGSRAAAEVHDSVREDLRDDDIRKEGNTLREQLLIPLTVYRFGIEAQSAAPYFRRVVEEAKDLKVSADLASIVVNDLGGRIPASYIEDELGITLADGEDRDAVLPGRTTSFTPFRDRRLGSKINLDSLPHRQCDCHRHKHVAHRFITTLLDRKRTAVGKTDRWILSAVKASFAQTQNVIDTVESFVNKGGSLDQSLADLPAIFADLPMGDMIELERQFLLAARLAGRDHSRQKLSANSAGRHLELVAHAEFNFDSIPFIKAIDSLRDRIELDPDTFLTLDAEARSRATRVAAVWNMRLLADIHRELANSVAVGETVRDFRLRLPQMTDRRGWTGENPWHADIVHYQNFVMAHAAGRLSEYQEFDVNAWRYVANGESCPICDPVIGKVFATNDRRFFPPLHFFCDCEDEPVFDSELQVGEVQDSSRVENTDLVKEQARDGGFKWDPAQFANLEPLRLSVFPEELRPVFRAFALRNGWEVIQ